MEIDGLLAISMESARPSKSSHDIIGLEEVLPLPAQCR
jgi:hypothetical protein